MGTNFSDYESGNILYGDNFSEAEILSWFDDEREGYADLGAKNRESYAYAYHKFNEVHGFQYLEKKVYNHVLGFGSAYGDEFLPIKDKVRQLTIIDPSSAFADVHNVHGIPCVYQQPQSSGNLEFDNHVFDLVVCLGVMHHIPNVSHVLKECYRCLESGGVMLIREPVISMGDWSRPRPGLTKRERGIPFQLFEKMIGDAGFTIRSKALCMFPLSERVARMLGVKPYNSLCFTVMDKLVCKLLTWNLRYHPKKSWHKLRPTSAYFVLVKN